MNADRSVSQCYLVETVLQQWCRQIERSLWSNVPVSTQVETIDEHYSLAPALHHQAHYHH